MAFQFRLDVVWRVRQSLEHQQELLLREANRQVLALSRHLAEVDAQIAQYASREGQRLETGLSAAELQFDRLCRSILQQHRGILEQQRAEAEHLREARAANFRQAKQKREVIETLRNHQLQLHRQQQQRQDQRRMDDLLLLRRAYLQHR
jgi:flagellar export protein FliJ